MTQLPSAPPETLAEEERLSLLLALSRGTDRSLTHLSSETVQSRIAASAKAEGVDSAGALLEFALRDPGCLARLMRDITRDDGPHAGFGDFAEAFLRHIVPLLRTYPSVRIWMPLCSTGLDAHLLAAVLARAGMAGRTRIYATDVNQAALECAEQGSYPAQSVLTGMAHLEASEPGYRQPWGVESGMIQFAPDIRASIIFAQHSIAADAPFNQFHVIVARQDEMTLLSSSLLARAKGLFTASLITLGFLCLAPAIRPHPSGQFTEIDSAQHIFRRVGP